MPELDDVQIDRPQHGPEHRETPPRKSSAVLWVVIVLVLLALGAGGYYYFTHRSATPPAEEVAAPAETVAPPAETTAEQTPQEENLPPLAASDEIVRQVVGALSARPALASWLATDGLVRRFVVATDNLAVGLMPRKQLPKAMAPKGKFAVVKQADGSVTVDPASYHRYDTFAAVVASIDAAGAVATYRRLEPLVDEAAAEIGYGPGAFDQRLVEAIRELLRAPVPTAPPALVEGVVSYRYADLRFQELTDAQKQLVRMGPDNERLIQAKLREIAHALNVPEDRIPKERVLTPDR